MPSSNTIEQLDQEGQLTPLNIAGIGDRTSDVRNAAHVFTSMRDQLAVLIDDPHLLDRVAYSAAAVTLRFQAITANAISDKVQAALPGHQFSGEESLKEVVRYLRNKATSEKHENTKA